MRKGKRCVSNAPVRYGRVTLASRRRGSQKVHIKASGKVLAALKQGRTLNVRVTLVFTPPARPITSRIRARSRST